MVRLVAWVAVGVAVLRSSTVDAATSPDACLPTGKVCDLPRYKPFLLLRNYAPAKQWCSNRYPFRTDTTTVTRTRTITRREDERLEERASSACRTTDVLCQIHQSLKQTLLEVQLALCACIQDKPPPVTKTNVVTVTRRDPEPEPAAVGSVQDTCPVDGNVCDAARFQPFALLRSYVPAKEWCAAKYPVKPITKTVTVSSPPAAAKAKITGRAELENRTACRAKDYQCSILQYLQSGPTTFAAAMCSCLQGKPTTALVTVTASAATTPTVATTPTITDPPPTTPTPKACSALSSAPSELTCGKNYVYSRPSNYKLIKLGGATTAADCAKDCKSTSGCLSFSCSAPETADGVAVCDLYSGSVSDLNANGALIAAPAPTGQKLQDFYDLGCFSCPTPASVTNPTPIPPPTTSTTTSLETTPTPTPPTACELRSSQDGASCGNSYVYSSNSYTYTLLLGHASNLVECATTCKSTKNCASFGFAKAADPAAEGICNLFSVPVASLESGQVIAATEAVDAQKFYDMACYSCPDAAVTTEAPLITTPTPTPPAPDCTRPTQVAEPGAATCNKMVVSVGDASRLDDNSGAPTDESSCSHRCFQDSTCRSFVFSSDTNPKTCTLYGKSYADLASSIPTTGDTYQGALYDLGCFSLPSECPAAPTRTELCIPVDYAGAGTEGYQCGTAAMLQNEDSVVSTSTVGSADSCKRKCKNNPSCKSFGVRGNAPSIECKLFTESYDALLAASAIGAGSGLTIYDAGCYGCKGHEPTPSPTPSPTLTPDPSCQPATQDETRGLRCNTTMWRFPAGEFENLREIQTDAECTVLCHADPQCQSFYVQIIENKRYCRVSTFSTARQIDQYYMYPYEYYYFPAIQASDRGCSTCPGETGDTPPAGTCELVANPSSQCPVSVRLLSTAHTVSGDAKNVASRKECAAWCRAFSGCAAFTILEANGKRQCLRFTKSVDDLEYTYGDIVRNYVFAPPEAPAMLMFDAACYKCEGGGAPTCDGDVKAISSPANAVCGTGADVTSQAAYLSGASTTAASLEDCARSCLTTSGCYAMGYVATGGPEHTCRHLSGKYDSLLGISFAANPTTGELSVFDANCFGCGSGGEAYTPLCNYAGYQYYGINEYATRAVADEHACADECAKDSQCRSYAYSSLYGESILQCHLFIATVGALKSTKLLRNDGAETFYTLIYNDRACQAPAAGDGTPICGRSAHFFVPTRSRSDEPRRVLNAATCVELCRTSNNCGAYALSTQPDAAGLFECTYYAANVHGLTVRQALTLPAEASASDPLIWDRACPNDPPHDTVQTCDLVAVLVQGYLQVDSATIQFGRTACGTYCANTARCRSYSYRDESDGRGICFIWAATTNEMRAMQQLSVREQPYAYFMTFDDVSCDAPMCDNSGGDLSGVYATADGLEAGSAAVLTRDEGTATATTCARRCAGLSTCQTWSVWYSAEGANYMCSLFSSTVAQLIAANAIAPEARPAGAGPLQSHNLYFDRGCSSLDLPVCGEYTHDRGSYAYAYLSPYDTSLYVDPNTSVFNVNSVEACQHACLDAPVCRSWAYAVDGMGQLSCSIFRFGFARLITAGYSIYPSYNDGQRPLADGERLFFDRICAVPAGPATAQPEKRGFHARRTIGM